MFNARMQCTFAVRHAPAKGMAPGPTRCRFGSRATALRALQ
jgi:hypothetical protein